MSHMTLNQICKCYQGPELAVKDFDLDIDGKEFVVFVGPSGCGKSTVLRMIAGLEEITSGELWMDGKLMNYSEPGERNISMVFQNYALYPNMSVYDNMAFSLMVRKVPKKKIWEKVTETAKMLGIEQLLDRRPAQLSGGQKQRVAIGSAILREPNAFLMDEPLSNLDAKMRAQMRVEIAKLYQRMNTTFIYVTHDQTEAMTLGTRIVVLKDGVVQQVDTPQNLYDHPASKFVAGFIGSPSMNFMKVMMEADGSALRIEGQQERLQVTEGTKEQINKLHYDGKNVILGIRPQDFCLEGSRESGNQERKEQYSAPIQVEVESVELLGAEQLVHFQLAGEKCVAEVSAADKIERGASIGLCINMERIHLFDCGTEQSILRKESGK